MTAEAEEDVAVVAEVKMVSILLRALRIPELSPLFAFCVRYSPSRNLSLCWLTLSVLTPPPHTAPDVAQNPPYSDGGMEDWSTFCLVYPSVSLFVMFWPDMLRLARLACTPLRAMYNPSNVELMAIPPLQIFTLYFL
jgi:hypothetical protein